MCTLAIQLCWRRRFIQEPSGGLRDGYNFCETVGRLDGFRVLVCLDHARIHSSTSNFNIYRPLIPLLLWWSFLIVPFSTAALKILTHSSLSSALSEFWSQVSKVPTPKAASHSI